MSDDTESTGMKLGRVAHPKMLRASVRLDHFIDAAALPTPPDSFDYTPAAGKSIARPFANDRLGDCVFAGGYHYLGVVTANAGEEFIATDQQVIHDYSAVTGYDGTRRTDRGANEQDALDYWSRKGFASGDKLAGWLKVGTGNLQLAISICWLFEHLYVGSSMPDAWCPPQNPGFLWQPGRGNQNNGHCFTLYGHASGKFKVATWGITGYLSDAAFQQNLDECYVLLSQRMVDKVNQKAPNAVDWPALVQYWNSLGGSIPNPPPMMTFSWD